MSPGRFRLLECLAVLSLGCSSNDSREHDAASRAGDGERDAGGSSGSRHSDYVVDAGDAAVAPGLPGVDGADDGGFSSASERPKDASTDSLSVSGQERLDGAVGTESNTRSGDGTDAGTDVTSGEGNPGYCGAVTTQLLIEAAGEPKSPADPLTEEAVEGSVCNAAIRTYPIATSHVTTCTDVEYNSNPPSSGMHYPLYPAFGSYAGAVPRGFWVHLLEHGGVALLYSCADCEAEVEQAQGLAETLPLDEGCCPGGTCPSDATNRMVLTPDPGLPTRWAAAAWGVTLTADCFELEVFERFARDHRGSSIETICSNASATDISTPPP